MSSKKFRVGVIGTRGFPEIQGGIETHCQELYTLLGEMGEFYITIYRRTPYLNEGNKNKSFTNIRFFDIRVPRSKYFETFLHSFFATIHAVFQKYDLVHYHNTGPGFFMPLLKLSGAKIVFTYHNISYTQQKWNKGARQFLSLSERICMKHSDYIIFISDVLKSEILQKYPLPKYKVVPNGVKIPEKSENTDYLESLGLEKHGYILSVGRFLEEKGFDYLIKSYKKAGIEKYRLVIVGDTDYPTEYSDRLKSFAGENDVLLTGFIKGEKLKQIYSFARLFVIASYSEGLPITLLEALSYGLDILASDIPANMQIGLKPEDYFKTGDEADLSSKMIEKITMNRKSDYLEYLKRRFNWKIIAEETSNIYKNLLE